MNPFFKKCISSVYFTQYIPNKPFKMKKRMRSVLPNSNLWHVVLTSWTTNYWLWPRYEWTRRHGEYHVWKGSTCNFLCSTRWTTNQKDNVVKPEAVETFPCTSITNTITIILIPWISAFHIPWPCFYFSIIISPRTREQHSRYYWWRERV